MDITLEAGTGHFSYRVGAVIIKDNHLLMVKNDNAPYYYSVGGRVRFNETSESAVLREVFEEIQVNMKIERLLFLHENFFSADFYENRPFHEIALFYLMRDCGDIINMKCDSLGCNGSKESIHWLPIDKLASYNIYPHFFNTELNNIGDEVGHFITKNNHTYPTQYRN